MSVTPGARLGPYEILAPVGAGGMGEVYKARDPRLGRDVAIKVLPVAFSADRERLQRFEQEARAAAALNHPNLLAVHDIGQHEGSPFIVSELLEGETLRERLSAGALPVRKAIEYAVQIAHGLAAAHEKGIVHRDLKPENIFATTDGRVKILDFGLAKLTQTEPTATAMSALPTTPPRTQAGIVLGTIGYMSPEQVRGLAADYRSDIFAFGAVLYEMLSGQRAFRGETPMDMMTAILKEDPPDLPSAERHIPPALERMVGRCLEKNPAARFHSADDLAFALEGLSSASTRAVATDSIDRLAHRPASRRVWALAVVATIGVAAAGVLGALYLRAATAPDAPPMRVDIVTPLADANDFASMAISPDGRHLVFAATSDGTTQLWIRSLDSTEARPLAGTEGGTLPFWSPDSRAIAFVAANGLKRIDIIGGGAQTLAANPGGRGTWNRDGVILIRIGPGRANVIYRVPANGGEATALTQVPGQSGHYAPEFLPDGRHFLYLAAGGTEDGVYIAALDAPQEARRLFRADTGAVVYASPGYLLFVREGVLFAQRFDTAGLALLGEPVQLAQQVGTNAGNISMPAVSASTTGLLAYRTVAPTGGARQLVWVDRSGKVIERSVSPDVGNLLSSPQLSPDGRWIAVSGVWLIDSARGVVTRFTPAGGNPVWSPDGARLAYGKGVANVYQKLASGGGAEEVLFETTVGTGIQDWSRDGRFLLVRPAGPKTGRDMIAVPLEGERRPFPIANTTFEEREGQFSPDGRWVAYASNESGRFEVYVQAFPEPTVKRQISAQGGNQPRWRRDGRELFYVAPDGMLMSVGIDSAGSSQTLEIGAPSALFQSRIVAVYPGGASHQYAVAPDGKRFLVNVTTDETTSAGPITLMLNWTAALEQPDAAR